MLKNIVVVSDAANVRGGAEEVAVNTAVKFAMKGYRVYFFSGTGEPDERLKKSSNIHIVNLGQDDLFHDKNRIRAFFSGIYNFQAARTFRKLLNTLESSETVVHVHQFRLKLSISVVKVAADMGFPVFITIHDYMLSCPATNFYNYVSQSICEITPLSIKCFLCNCDKRHYYHKLWRFIRQYVQDKVILNLENKKRKLGYIFISEFSRCQLLRRISIPKNQFFVRNPISFNDRFRIHVENNSIFLFIGRIDYEKGITNFCKVINETGVNGVVIGDGELRTELEAKYPEIKFTGWLDKAQILEWLKKTRCLVFPSVLYEVSPLVPSEVNAYGIPVISSDCTAATDNAAFVYHSIDELRNLIKKVNTQDITELSESIYNNFDEGVTTDYVDKLLEVYSTPLR